jgi:hypothetical protein
MHDRAAATSAFLGVVLAIGLPTDTLGAQTAPVPLKYHPGHYLSIEINQGQEAIRDSKRPGVVGVQKRYPWAELEPEPDRYDFSHVESDLTLAAKLGLQFVMFVEDKSFIDRRPTPEYLRDRTLRTKNGGWVAERWDPKVRDRFARLLKAIGARFDGHPAFEGIALQESALALPEQSYTEYGYTPELYRDALIDTLKNARTSLPSSQIFWYMNFLEGGGSYLADVAEAVVAYHIAMGGPDVIPDHPGLQRFAYPLYQRYAGRLTLFCSIQNAEYALRRRGESEGLGVQSGQYWTLEELFAFARDRLHVQYLFWDRKTWRKPPDSYDWTDALEVIRKNPAFNK